MKACAVAHITDSNTEAQAGSKYHKMSFTDGDCSSLAADCASYYDEVAVAIK